MGEKQEALFCYFCNLKYFIVGGRVVVAWSRRSYLGLAEIASFVSLILFKDGGRRVSPRFHLFVPYVNQGKEETAWVQDFLA